MYKDMLHALPHRGYIPQEVSSLMYNLVIVYIIYILWLKCIFMMKSTDLMFEEFST